MRRWPIAVTLLAAALIATSLPAAGAQPYPVSIPLPDGFYPEGIAVGTQTDFYVSSLLDGAIYKGNLRTGEGAVLADGIEGRYVAGVFFDRRSGLLWGVGADNWAGRVWAFDGSTGAVRFEVPVPGNFLNDLVVARDAIYITDSLHDAIWVVPLTNRGAPAGPVVELPLSGDFEFVTDGELPINLNGIELTPDGQTLLAVHTTLGIVYRIHPVTGHATEVDLGGETVEFGDGVRLLGRTLYVVQNFPNQVAVVDLAPGFASGAVVERVESELFRVPTTAAIFGDNVYLVNARFDEAFPPLFGADPVSIDYDVVAIPRH